MIQRFVRWGAMVAVLAALPGSARLHAQTYYPDEYYDAMAARIWFDRGEEPVLGRGEQVRVYYHTSLDAFVAIFNIDTNGTVRLLYPRSPDENNYVRGGQDYRLLFPRSSYWYVDDNPGMGYYFVVASPEPFDFSRFAYSYYDRGWDLTQVGRTVYSDPYVAMDDYVSSLLPDWQSVPYALDFSAYHVGDHRYEYPRFLCYDCHGFRPYAVWDPYYYECTRFRVVAYDDPYYYPAYRYRGSRVVYVRPPEPRQPRYVFKERAQGESGRVLVTSRPPVADRPGLGGDPAPRRSTSGIGSGGEPARGQSVPSVLRPGGSASGRPSDAGAPRRGGGATGASGRGVVEPVRPSDALPGRGEIPVIRGSANGRAQPGGAVTGRKVVPDPVRPQDRPRPVLERRSGDAATRGNGGAAVVPPTRGGAAGKTVDPPRRGSGSAAGSGGGGGVRSTPTRPTVRLPAGRGGGGSVRPSGGATTRSSGGSAGRSSGGGATRSRPPVRSSGGSAARSSGGSAARSSGGGATRSRPPVRSRGGSAARSSGGSAARSSGGGATRSRPPVRRVRGSSGGH